MVYSQDSYQPSVLELARAGNLRAIAYWLNSYLAPQGIYASVRASRAGCLQILVEFQRPPERDRLVRFICHRLYKLNSQVIAGVQIFARFAGDSEILWQQSVRLTASPSRQRVQRKHHKSQSHVKQLLNQRAYLQLARSLLLSGSAVGAFVLGCLLSYNDNPTLPTIASAFQRSVTSESRSDTVRTALETVPVVEHENLLSANDPNVTLMFGGDVTLADAFADTVGDDYGWAFANMNEYRQADVAMVNLENPLTKATTPLPDKAFNFKADPESVKVLLDGGVDIVNLANNHTMDYQTAGLVETMATLNQAGIHHIGAGRDIQEARRPEIIEVKGQRIAYLGYYDSDLHAAGETTPGTNARRNEQVAADIRAIRKQVDWVVVNYHWGQELAEQPGDWQVELAHFTIDQGADLVVGHHPHVLQGAEIYKGRPIAYSLGNFIFGGNNRSDYDTAVLKVALRDKQMKVEFLPVEVTQYQPQVVSGDRGAEILAQIEERSQNFAQPMPTSVILDAKSSKVVTPSTSDSPFAAPQLKQPSESPPSQPLTPQPETNSDDSFINVPAGSPDQVPSAPLDTQPTLSPDSNSEPESPEQPFTDPGFDTPTSQPQPFSDPDGSTLDTPNSTSPTDSFTPPETDQPPAFSEPSPSPFDSQTDPFTTPNEGSDLETPTTAPSPSDSFTAPFDESTPENDSPGDAPSETEIETEPAEEGSQPFNYPYREEPDDYWQPLIPESETQPTDSTPAPVEPSSAPDAPELEAAPDNEFSPESPAVAPTPSESETAPFDSAPTTLPGNTPGNSTDPFISAPEEAAPLPVVPEAQGQTEPEVQPVTPEPPLTPSQPRKRPPRERIALLPE